MAVRSLAVIALALAIAQVASGTFCGCFEPYGGVNAAASAQAAAIAAAGAEFDPVTCCPGPVIEKKSIVTKPVTIPYTYSVPTFSKKCFKTTDVDRKVIPSSTVAQQCNQELTTIKLPTTDVITQQTPLCKRTCTTSEYVIQIPIVETTCTNSPLCKKTVKSQDNFLTTVAQKTSCNKQVCSSNKIIERPLFQTVCQDYQGALNKIGTKTVLKPEVIKKCVQLPPYKCLKPGFPAPGFPAPGFPAPGFPVPGFPAPGFPYPGFPAPGLPAGLALAEAEAAAFGSAGSLPYPADLAALAGVEAAASAQASAIAGADLQAASIAAAASQNAALAGNAPAAALFADIAAYDVNAAAQANAVAVADAQAAAFTAAEAGLAPSSVFFPGSANSDYPGSVLLPGSAPIFPFPPPAPAPLCPCY